MREVSPATTKFYGLFLTEDNKPTILPSKTEPDTYKVLTDTYKVNKIRTGTRVRQPCEAHDTSRRIDKK